MEELHQELIHKLSDLNSFIEKNAEELLEVPETAKITDQGQVNIKNQEETSDSEKLAIIALMSDRLEALSSLLLEITGAAKNLLAANKGDCDSKKQSALGLFPSPEVHQQLLAEHREQQIEKQRKRAAVALLESRFTVKNLVDSAAFVGQADSAEDHEKTKEECCFLFSRGLPVEKIAEHLEDLLDEKWTMARSPQKLKEEAERQLALNESAVAQYVSTRGGSDSLGHVVHRLLALKYPRPPVPPGHQLPRLNVMGLLLGLDDLTVTEPLSNLLAEVKVTLVQIQDAVEFCIEAYRVEGPGIPLLESKEPLPTLDTPEEVVNTALILPLPLQQQLKVLEPPPKQKDADTQTCPDITPQLSMAASLGKQVLEVLRLKEQLSDWMTTAIVIEYLKQVSSGDVLGWILVDFPATFEQCRLFEASISGQWVPDPDKPNEKQGGRYSLVQSKIVLDPADPVEAVMPFNTIFTSVVSVSNCHPQEFFPLMHEVYLRQGVFACLHCSSFDQDKINSVAELLLRSSPNPPVPRAQPNTENPFPDFEIPSDLALCMTALWEAIETAYLGRLHRVTLTQRIMQNMTSRYLKTIKKQFSNFLGRDNRMQSTVDDFVQRYNEVPRPWDKESTEELRNQVKSLEETIKEQIETRQGESLVEMKSVSEQPWLGRQLNTKLTLVASMAQLELDRFVDTAALLQDYCSASLGKVPPDATKSLRFEVPKVFEEDISDGWNAVLAEIVLADEPPSRESVPEEFKAYTLSVLESAKTYFTKIMTGLQTEIGKIENEVKPKPQKGKADKSKKGKKAPTFESIPNLADLELERLTAKKLQLLQEWRDMIGKEAELTLSTVERQAEIITAEAENLIYGLWSNGLQIMRAAACAQSTSDRQSMHELKEFLDSAVETSAKLNPPILLPLKTEYQHILKGSKTSAPSQRDKNFCQHLRDLMKVLRRLAPDGQILLSGLSYLLHQSAASGKHLPPKWAQLDKEQVQAVLQGYLNGASVVDWRALLVGLMELPEANQYQLVVAAELLKEGTRKTVSSTHLWFDSNFDDEEEALEAKMLLFDVYLPQDHQEKIDTLQFLSATIYDEDPMAGFLKCCAIHQRQVLTKKQKGFGEVAYSDSIALETAINACQAVVACNEEDLGPRLQQIWNEVEEVGLSDEQKRIRNRAVAAGNYEAVDVDQVSVELLQDYEPMIGLAREYFGKKRLSNLVDNIIGSSVRQINTE